MGKRSFLAILYVFFFTTWHASVFATNTEKHFYKPVSASTLTVTIIPQDTVDPTPIYCTNVPYHFTGFATPGPISFWHWYCAPSIGVTISDSLQNGTDVTFASLGTYTLSVIATNINGVTDTATYTINAPGVLQTPTVSVFPLAPTVCNGGTGTTLYAVATTTAGTTTYTWSPVSGGLNTFPSDPNNDSVNVNPSSFTLPKNFTYTVVGEQNGCISMPVPITVTVSAPPTPNYTSNPNPLCSGKETVLTVNNMPSYATYTWTQTNNTGGIGTPSGFFVQATPIYYGAGDTTFTYNVSLDVQGCPPYPNQPHTFNVLVHPTPYIIVADTVQDCNKMGDTLRATYIYPTTNVGLIWTMANLNVITPLKPDTNTVFVNPSKTTTSIAPVKYYVTPTAHYYSPANMTCTGKTDSVVVVIGDTTNTSISYLYSIICAGKKDTLFANPANNQLNNSYHYTWSPQSSIFHTSADGDTVVIQPSATTTYTLDVKGICVNKKRAELTVAVNTGCPAAPVGFSANNYTICAGATHCITYTDLTVKNGGLLPLFYTWVFPGEAIIKNAGGGQVYGKDTLYYAAIDTSTMFIKPIKVCYPLTSYGNVTSYTATTGLYPVKEFVKNGLGDIDSMIRYVDILSGPHAIASSNPTTVQLGNSATLSGSAVIGSINSNIVSYNWTASPDTVDCSGCQNPVVTPYTTTSYTLVVVDQKGCSDSAFVTIYVDNICKDAFIATAFSPNGDGVNDVLHVKSNCELSSFSFKIFDRWGEKVFESSDPNYGWDGTYKNKPMDTGVFMYTVDGFLSTGVEVKKKGNVTLLR
jgi:gliding motility-associated-like protein